MCIRIRRLTPVADVEQDFVVGKSLSFLKIMGYLCYTCSTVKKYEF